MFTVRALLDVDFNKGAKITWDWFAMRMTCLMMGVKYVGPCRATCCKEVW